MEWRIKLTHVFRYLLVAIVFIFTFIRIIPKFSVLGRDFFSTLDSYPNDIADGYGIYYYVGLWLGYFEFDFIYFWLFISILLSISLAVFLKKILDYNQAGKIYSLLVLFVIGFTLPWFGFQNYRYGAALLILFSAYFIVSNIKKSLTAFFACCIHPLAILWVVFYFIIEKLKNKLLLAGFLLLFGFFYFNYSEDINFYILGLLKYDMYAGDLIKYSESETQIFVPFVRCFLFLIVSQFVLKGLASYKFFYITFFYFITVYFTPFHGRLLPGVYIYLLILLTKQESISNIGYFVVFSMLLGDSVNAFLQMLYNG